ncbi:hypothetical protein P7C70_g5631, partial [Phenoliferia sp. Uapishka_3]
MAFGDILVNIIPTSQISTTFFPPTPTFLPERDIPSLAGKVVIVTGGNAGIGFETCRQLLLHDAKVYLGARSSAKANAAIDTLKNQTGKDDIHFLELDLGDLRGVRAAADTFLRGEAKLDVLFNNAGVMTPPTDQLTSQGYDLQMGTNVLGPYFFTKLLLPALKAAHGRIINTSSSGHHFTPGESGLDFATFDGGNERDRIIKSWGLSGSWKLYGQSKLGNVVLSNLWARELAGEVYSCALHPGGIKTELQRHSAPWLQQLAQYLLYPAHMGAWTQLYAGTTAEPSQINGQADAKAANVATQELLRSWLDEQLEKY